MTTDLPEDLTDLARWAVRQWWEAPAYAMGVDPALGPDSAAATLYARGPDGELYQLPDEDAERVRRAETKRARRRARNRALAAAHGGPHD